MVAPDLTEKSEHDVNNEIKLQISAAAKKRILFIQ